MLVQKVVLVHVLLDVLETANLVLETVELDVLVHVLLIVQVHVLTVVLAHVKIIVLVVVVDVLVHVLLLIV